MLNRRPHLFLVVLILLAAVCAQASETEPESLPGPFDRIHGAAWSPDGKWLAYGFSESRNGGAIHLLRVPTGKITRVTHGDFRDECPSFDPDGKYLYFLSWRVFDPVYDMLNFDLGFPKGARPYLVALKKGTPSPFSAAYRFTHSDML